MTKCLVEKSTLYTPDMSLQDLHEGNLRYIHGNTIHTNSAISLRPCAASQAQNPKAIILTCSDSRVPVEAIFDQHIGDLFVIRVVGNTIGPAVLGSIEYGVKQLKIPLVVIMGHTHCAAVTSACKEVHADSHMGKLLRPLTRIISAIRQEYAKVNLAEEDLIELAVEANVTSGIISIKKHYPEFKNSIDKGLLKISGAVYNIEDGKVNWLS